MAPKAGVRKIHISAKTGRCIKKGYVKKHPDTTVTETVKVPKKK